MLPFEWKRTAWVSSVISFHMWPSPSVCKIDCGVVGNHCRLTAAPSTNTGHRFSPSIECTFGKGNHVRRDWGQISDTNGLWHAGVKGMRTWVAWISPHL